MLTIHSSLCITSLASFTLHHYHPLLTNSSIQHLASFLLSHLSHPLIQAQAFTLSVLHSSILNALECPLGRTGFLERVAIQCEVKDE